LSPAKKKHKGHRGAEGATVHQNSRIAQAVQDRALPRRRKSNSWSQKAQRQKGKQRKPKVAKRPQKDQRKGHKTEPKGARKKEEAPKRARMQQKTKTSRSERQAQRRTRKRTCGAGRGKGRLTRLRWRSTHATSKDSQLVVKRVLDSAHGPALFLCRKTSGVRGRAAEPPESNVGDQRRTPTNAPGCWRERFRRRVCRVRGCLFAVDAHDVRICGSRCGCVTKGLPFKPLPLASTLAHLCACSTPPARR
jgi:hypothetical protein